MTRDLGAEVQPLVARAELLAITVGAGRRNPIGSYQPIDVSGAGRVEAFAAAVHAIAPAPDAWLSCHLFDRSHRQERNWKAAAVVMGDLDWHALGEKKPTPPAAVVAQLVAAAKAGQIPGSVFHLTPHGARPFFVLERLVDDPEVMKAITKGAGLLVQKAIVALGLGEKAGTGYVVDTNAQDLARFMFTPRAIVDGKARDAEVIVMRAEPYTVAELMPPAAPSAKATSTSTAAGSTDINQAARRWNADHPLRDLPRAGAGDCPVCEGQGGFGALPERPGKWFCWHATHPDTVGRKTDRGHFGDALDLEAHRLGRSRVDVLKVDGYLLGRETNGHANGSNGAARGPVELADYDDSPAALELATSPAALPQVALGKANGASIQKTALEQSKSRPLSPLDIVRRWREQGKILRISTGIPVLDDLCGGGFPSVRRVFINGAPTAGKTFIQKAIELHMARQGTAVGHLAVDEDADDCTVRDVQMFGFSIDQAETRDHDVLDRMEQALAELPIRYYDASWTIEAAGADLATWAKARGVHAALFIDSLHTALSDAALAIHADSEREVIKANVDAVRSVVETHAMLVVATAEANRASYRSEEAAAASNDLASGAETRAIEYGAQTMLMLRTPRGHNDVVHVTVAKNRRASVGEFWLRLNRAHHELEECSNPAEAPETAAKREQDKRARNLGEVERDANVLCDFVRERPGIGERQLRAALRAEGNKWGIERYDAARERLLLGLDTWQLVDRGTGAPGKPRIWHVQATRGAA